ncbi:hypothetical protein [Providencia sneebia]|uniref:Uncharacterized protein n=1 Tax=Providencia sneebia DSM 19967 TaxID=1141660 RepID=K8W990_9GAMM|nr:hypothetical protein [Providencia sneebia]EKT56426.1 hypothetical protein OO7_10822 [Providencia sneebia DSM 19967]
MKIKLLNDGGCEDLSGVQFPLIVNAEPHHNYPRYVVHSKEFGIEEDTSYLFEYSNVEVINE